MSKGPEVLIIDDDRMDRNILENMIHVLDYSSCCVSDATSAIEQLKSGAFKIVFSEWKLIKSQLYDGFVTLNSLIESIRNGEAGVHHVNIPVVAITDHIFSCTSQVTKTVGLTGVVYKPFNVADIRNVVIKCVLPS